MHRRRQQPVVARLSLLPLSREESPINKRMKKKRGVICLG